LAPELPTQDPGNSCVSGHCEHYGTTCCVKVKTIQKPGNTKVGSITVPLTSRLNGLDQSVLQIKTKTLPWDHSCSP